MQLDPSNVPVDPESASDAGEDADAFADGHPIGEQQKETTDTKPDPPISQ